MSALSPLLLALVCLAADEPLEPYPGHQIGPVPDGAVVSLRFSSAPLVVGGKIEAIFTLENKATSAFAFETGGDYRGSGFPLRCKVVVTDAQGNRMPDLTGSVPCFGGIVGTHTLKPGEKFDQTLPLLGYARLGEPGRYTLRVVHDFGWKATNERKHPVAEASFDLALPSAKQAASRVTALCEVKESEKEASWDASWELRKLGHPVYLPALKAKAQDGFAIALEGIAGIETVEATEALVELLKHPKKEIGNAAVCELIPRIPVDGGKGDSLPYFREWGQYDPARLPKLTWQRRFRNDVLAAGREFLAAKDTERVKCGGWIIAAIGSPKDMPVLRLALQWALDDFRQNRTSPTDDVLDEPGALYSLLPAVDALRERGYRSDGIGRTAELMIFFRQLADKSIPRPPEDKWMSTLQAFMAQNPASLREAALRAIPLPMNANWLKYVDERLEDEDLGVMKTACEVAGESEQKHFVAPLVQIVETCQHTWVLRAASDAAWKLGARTQLWEAWARRITDKELMYDALRVLMRVVDGKSHSGGGSSNLSRDERFTLRDAWLKFLAKHHDRLESGKLFAADDPALTTDLAGKQAADRGDPAISINLDNGRTWPPRKSMHKE
jgi:hypothetical protein